MRRIVAFDNVSADGYFSAADGSLGWVTPEEEIYKEAMSKGPGIGAMLFGRKTYEMFEKGWRHAADDDGTTAPDPHDPRRRSHVNRAQAVWINETPKVVFSRTLPEVTWKNSRLVRELDPRAIEAMKNEPGPDMIVFGSGEVVARLTEHGLVDEYQLVVNPVLLGGGRNLVRDLASRRALQLQDAKSYPLGSVLLRYAPAG